MNFESAWNNHLEMFLNQHSKINWKKLSSNPNVNIELVRKFKDKEWNWKVLSKIIKIEDIRKNLDLPWDYKGLSQNPTLKLKDFEELSISDKKSFCQYGNFSVEDYKTATFDWKNSTCSNKNINYNLITKKDFCYLSSNPTIDINFIEKNLDKKWDWNQLSLNMGVSIDEILNNLEMPWNWNLVSKRPDLEFKHVFSNKLDWNINYIQKNLIKNDFRVDKIHSFPKRCKGCYICNNFKIIFGNILGPRIKSQDPNLTFEMVNRMPNVLLWDLVSCNSFKKEYENFKKKFDAVVVIKKWWVGLFWNPNTFVGRKRLERSFQNEQYDVWNK